MFCSMIGQLNFYFFKRHPTKSTILQEIYILSIPGPAVITEILLKIFKNPMKRPFHYFTSRVVTSPNSDTYKENFGIHFFGNVSRTVARVSI